MQRIQRNTGGDFREIAPLSKNRRSNRDTGGGETLYSASGLTDALRAYQAFMSVGHRTFDVTFLEDQTKRNAAFSKNTDLLAKTPDGNLTVLESALERNGRERVSFIVRPRGEAKVVQVDDCDASQTKVLLPYSFLAIETSRENYQVWLAFHEAAKTVSETRKRLLRKLGGDVEASGSMRFPGSINWKPGRGAFQVRVIRAANGRFTSARELEENGLLACATDPPVLLGSYNAGFKSKLPDYQKCLDAKKNDRSRADASFLGICMARGFSRDESKSALYRLSEKANESGDAYVERTLDFVFGEGE